MGCRAGTFGLHFPGARTPHGFLTRSAAKLAAVNLGLWLNRLFARPALALATLLPRLIICITRPRRGCSASFSPHSLLSPKLAGTQPPGERERHCLPLLPLSRTLFLDTKVLYTKKLGYLRSTGEEAAQG